MGGRKLELLEEPERGESLCLRFFLNFLFRSRFEFAVRLSLFVVLRIADGGWVVWGRMRLETY